MKRVLHHWITAPAYLMSRLLINGERVLGAVTTHDKIVAAKHSVCVQSYKG